MDTLLILAKTADAEVAEILAVTPKLTPYGVEYRYPGDYPEVTSDDAEQALNLALLVRAEILRRLPDDVHLQGEWLIDP